MYSSYVAPGIMPTYSTYGYGAPMTTTTYNTGLPIGSVYPSTYMSPYTTSYIGSPMMNLPFGTTYGGHMGMQPMTETTIEEETGTTQIPQWMW